MEEDKAEERERQTLPASQYSAETSSVGTVRSFHLTGTPYQYDPEFKGPVWKRTCTDVICLLVFVAFITAWIGLATFAYLTGDPSRLILPVDSLGNVCGRGTFQDRPNLFFFDITKCLNSLSSPFQGCPTTQVCVDRCPRMTFAIRYRIPVNYNVSEAVIRQNLICKYDVSTEGRTLEELADSGDCASYYLISESVGKRCLPKIFNNFGAPLVNLLIDGSEKNVTDTQVTLSQGIIKRILQVREYGEMGLKDLQASWRHLLVFIAIAMGLSFLWILVVRWLAGTMVWLSIFLVLIVVAFAFFYSLQQYADMEVGTTVEVYTFLAVDSYQTDRGTWLDIAIVSGVIFTLTMVILLCLRHKLAMAIALIQEAGRVIGCMPSTLIFPIFMFGLELGILAFGGSVAIYLAGHGKSVRRVFNDSLLATWAAEAKNVSYEEGCVCNSEIFRALHVPLELCTFASYGITGHIVYAQVFNLFCTFWVIGFLLNLERLSLALAFSSYYWAFQKPNDVPALAVVRGFFTSLRYHMGSLALGSLVLLFVRITRIVFQALAARLDKRRGSASGKFMLRCFSFCLKCLEKYIVFVNKNAYIVMAVHAKPFFAAAWKASTLFIRNMVRVVIVDRVGNFLTFVGRLVIVTSMGVLAFLFFARKIPFVVQYVPELNYMWLPMVVVVLVSYTVTSCFFSVFDMAVDTLFVCFLEDLERNDGSRYKPYFMPKNLMEIFGRRNSFPEEQFYREVV